jgi:hypothetical protein
LYGPTSTGELVKKASVFKTIKCTPYSVNVILFTGDDEVFLRRKFKLLKKKIPSISYEEEDFIQDTKDHHGFVQFGFLPYLIMHIKDVSNMNTVVHESVHATSNIFGYVGMEHTAETDEAYAYMVGYIVEQILEGKK